MLKKNDVVVLKSSGRPAIVVDTDSDPRAGRKLVRIAESTVSEHYWTHADAVKLMVLSEPPKPVLHAGDIVWTTAEHCHLIHVRRIDTSKPAIVGGGSYQGNPGIYAQMQRLGSEDTRVCICYVPVESLTLARVEPRETT